MKITVFSNLYPSSSAPHRGVFNAQKFKHLSAHHSLQILVPVPWIEWLKGGRPKSLETLSATYFPYWYPPKFGRRLYGNFLAESARTTHRDVKAFSPDVVYGSYLFPDGFAAASLAKRFNRPLVLGLHGSDVNVHLQYPSRRKRLLKTLSYANRTISVSAALKGHLTNAGADPDRIVPIYNGIDRSRFYPKNKDEARQHLGLGSEPLALFVGNLLRSKGVFDFLRALADLDQLPLQGYIVGTGGDSSELDASIAQSKVRSRVHRVGPKPHSALPDWFAAADVICLPSYREGVPNVLLEAMASGRPVVATRVGGIPEIVTPDCGILVDAGDTHSLSHALREAMQTDWDPDAISSNPCIQSWEANAEQISRELHHAAREGARRP
ncbi:MAG: glycosyltransferase [Pseudomonadota bacterium]